MQDLFEVYETLPKKMQQVCEYYWEKQASEGLTYIDCKVFLQKVELLGYTFEYGLDSEPFNLQKLTLESNESETNI